MSEDLREIVYNYIHRAVILLDMPTVACALIGGPGQRHGPRARHRCSVHRLRQEPRRGDELAAGGDALTDDLALLAELIASCGEVHSHQLGPRTPNRE
jgi:hypothetical protein